MKFARAATASLFIGGLLVGTSSLAPQITFASEPVVIESTADELHDVDAPLAGGNAGSTNASVNSNEPLAPLDVSQEPNRFDVTYIDENCDERLAEKLLPIDAETSELKAGWYVLRENVELKSTLTLEGDVRIILSNGCKLKAPKGIRVKKDSSLTLYGQKDASGVLEVRGGIKLQLTDVQKREADERIAREREVDPNYQEPEPTLLYVRPCLEVVAGDHEPWPADATTPDPDPDHAPKKVEKPALTSNLISKDYLVIRPLSTHPLEMEGDAFLIDGDHFTCTVCDKWFEDIECHHEMAKPEPATVLAVGAEYPSVGAEADMITITFDANGGSGYMEPMQVEAGEKFTLPECDFAAPEGQRFSTWSIGAPGSVVSVPNSMTVRAWWKNAPSSASSSQSSGGTASDGSAAGVNAGSASSSAEEPTASSTSSTTPSNGSSTSGSPSGSPDTADSLSRWSGVTLACVMVGSSLVLVGKLDR